MIRIERYTRQLMLAMSFMLAAFLAGCGGGGGGGGQDPILGTGAIADLMSISVTPANSTTPKGLTRQFAATGVYSDGTTRDISTAVAWSSGTPAIATITTGGLASGLQIGSALMTATFGSKSGNTTLTVTAAVLSSMVVTPVNPNVGIGTTQQFRSIGAYSDGTSQDVTTSVVWTSAAPVVATMNASGAANSGLASALTSGTSIITASLSGISANTTLRVTSALTTMTITPLNPSVARGLTRQFAALGTFADGTTQDFTTQATWASATPSVATMNASGFTTSGLATAQALGTSVISATFAGVSGSTSLNVTAATLRSLAVTPTNPSVGQGFTRQFIALGTLTDNSVMDVTTSATWSSANTAIATLNPSGLPNSGLATGLAIGSSVITASVGLITGNTTLNVVTPPSLTSIAVTPVNPSVVVGLNRQFIARGTYADGSVVDISSTVVWTSSVVSVAIVNPSGQPNSGLAFGVAPGVSVITATLGLISGQTNLTVAASTLTSISVTPTNPTIAIGANQQFTAFANYSNGTTLNVTNAVNWTSATPAVAVIVNGTGLATGIAAGTSLITATMGSSSGNTLLTVQAAAPPPITPITFGAADPFGGFGGNSGMTNQGILTVVNADIGTTGASTLITGFHDNSVAYTSPLILAPAGAGCTYTETTLNIGNVTGRIYTAAPPPTVACPLEGTAATANTAALALAAAQNAWSNTYSPAGMPGGTDPGAGQLGGLTLPAGIYQAAGGSFLITGSNLVLDGQGNANARWVFQTASSLTVGAPGAPRSVTLINGAQARNVVWRVGSAATINAAGGGTMVGTIIANAGISFSTAGNVALVTLNGRALSLNASVTLVNTVINLP